MGNKKYLISANLGGISNRVKCLISLLRLKNELKRDQVILYWPLNHTCGAKFSDLFKNKITELSYQEFNELPKNNTKKVGENSLTINNFEEQYLICETWKFLLKENEIKENNFLEKKREAYEDGIDLNFSDIPEEIKKDILCYLKLLRPVDWINEEVNNFSKKNNLGSMVGLHIRRGDFADRKVSPGKVSSDEKFIERMKQILEKDPNTLFFLCTDSKEIEDKLEKEFRDKIIKYTKTSFVRTDVKATQEGLVDLMLLSKTKHILGTYRSTFTEMAWWFGECNPRIEIIIDKEKETAYLKNVKKENKRIVPKIKKIILNFIRKTK